MSEIRPRRLFKRIEQASLSALTTWLGLGVLALLLALPVADARSHEPHQPNARRQVPDSDPDHDVLANATNLEPRIDQLLALLDSRQYEQREQASRDLARLGEPAIGPLAYRSLECSPETRWRIKKTLERICTSGTEPVFLKSVAILKLQFDLGSTNNPDLAIALAKLESEWKKRRKVKAVATLRKSGATVNDPFEDIDVGKMFPGTYQPVVTQQRTTVKASFKKPSDRELRKSIKAILASDIDENRVRVFGNAGSATPDPSNPGTLADNRNRAQLVLQNQIQMNQLLIGRQPGFDSSGVSVEIGDRWTGGPDDLNLLGDVDNIQELTFVNQSISNESFVNLARIATLTRLVFDNCKFDAQGFRDANWPILNEVELRNQEISSSLMEACAAIPLIRSMSFTACRLNGSLLNKLSQSKQLRMLQFNEIEIENAVFEAIEEMKQVNYVNLSACKFQTDNYQALTAARPNLQIAFTAQAFFGVRGPVNNIGLNRGIQFDDRGQPIPFDAQPGGVTITDVIAGSGAQLAGMKVGDVIENVNGQAIEKFEDLRLQIAQHRVGDQLEVTVRRNNDSIKLKVTLGSQKEAPRF